MQFVVDHAELVVVPLILARAARTAMGAAHSSDGVVCAPATLAVCACGSELPEWDDDWDADRPAVHHLDPEDCVAPVPDDRTLEAELAVDEPAPRAWTAPVADAAREAERLRASRAAEVAESEKVFLGEFRAMLGAGVRLVVRPSTAQRAPAGAAVVAATLGLADDERSVEWSLDGGAATSIPLAAVLAVTGAPIPHELGDELSARSFIIVGAGERDATLFHCPSPDIAGLCVDGLQMLVDHERKKQRRGKAAPAKGPPLAEANRLPVAAV